MLEIKSNYQDRQFIHGHDIPDTIHDDYDHLDGYERSDGWIKYRGNYYHTSDFMRINDVRLSDLGWHGIHNCSAFSGTVIQLSDCGEGYKIGFVTC